MRELDAQNKVNKRMYFTYCSIAILFIFSGLLTTFLRHEYWIKLIIHSFFVFIVSVLTLYYPFKETNLIRALLMFSITLYFYALFLLYPDTTSTIALIYFAPTISIVLFNRKIFASVLIFNIFFGTGLFIGLN